ncbi:MAG: DUF167 domain-containing protein [Chloroflexota bacterium]
MTRGADEVRLPLWVTPRGGRDAIEGVRDGRLLMRVAASPVDGDANDSVIRLIAQSLDVPRSAVRLVTGAAARRKVVAVSGVSALEVAARWPDLGV